MWITQMEKTIVWSMSLWERKKEKIKAYLALWGWREHSLVKTGSMDNTIQEFPLGLAIMGY